MISLDVGCGHSSEHIKKAEVGIDLEKGLCDVQASAYQLPFRNQTFDRIIMSHILEHLENFSVVLDEVSRVLIPVGTLEIEVPNPSAFWVFKDYVFSRKVKLGGTGIDKTHVCSFGEAELQNVMRIKGFTTVKIIYCNSSWHKKRFQSYNSIRQIFYRILFQMFPAFQTALKIHAKK